MFFEVNLKIWYKGEQIKKKIYTPLSGSASRDRDADSSPMWDMGNMRKVVVRNIKGKTYIDIREYYIDKNTKDTKPGKKGISLTCVQYQKLKSVIEDIDHALPLSSRIKKMKHFKWT